MTNAQHRSTRVAPTVLLLSLLTASVALSAPADLVVRAARILTLDPDQPTVQTFAVTDSRFVRVGDDADMATLIGAETRVLNLSGQIVVPGFIDAHAHPRPIYPPASPYARVACDPESVRSMDELIAALRRKSDQTSPGQWVLGSGYQETKLGGHPTRSELDRASTNHPVLITHSSGHRAVCNSFALRMAKVTRDTPDPLGAAFGRDQDGEPNGLLLERASAVVRAYGPARPTPPKELTVAAYRTCFSKFLSRGVTAVGVAGTSLAGARLLEKARTPDTPLRLYIMLREGDIQEAAERHGQDELREFAVRYGGIKLFHGNSLSGQTCWLSKPYANRPDYFGVPPARTQKSLNHLIRKVHDAGLQACVHSNGDREIEMVLNAIEQALKDHPRLNHRHRIEHGSVMTQELLARIKELGIVVAPHSYIWEHGDKMEAYGQWRWNWMHPARALLDLGIPVAGNSDYPVSAADPLLRIADHVLRQSADGKVYGPQQRITPEEALKVWTLGAAFSMFAEDRIGSIAEGKLADFVVLGADPTETSHDQIKDIPILQTFVGGTLAWEP